MDKDDSLYLGFGFDSIANDYKILRIATKHICNLLRGIVVDSSEPEAELYSVNANSWKKIKVPDIKKIFLA